MSFDQRRHQSTCLTSHTDRSLSMDVAQIIDAYYDAWINKKGDMSEVALAADLAYKGPVASFTDGAGFRQMAKEAGAAVTAFTVRRQFTEGNTVCSIVDWEMSPARAGAHL